MKTGGVEARKGHEEPLGATRNKATRCSQRKRAKEGQSRDECRSHQSHDVGVIDHLSCCGDEVPAEFGWQG